MFFDKSNYFYTSTLPSPTLYSFLDSGKSDIHRGGPATASYASLSMGIQPQRNTLCCISWPSPVSVINHKTMKAINRSLTTPTPFPTTISLNSKLIKALKLSWEKLWGMAYSFQSPFHNERPFAEDGIPMFFLLSSYLCKTPKKKKDPVHSTLSFVMKSVQT